MKRIICLMVIMVLMFSLAACGGLDLPEPPPSAEEAGLGEEPITAADMPEGDPPTGRDSTIEIVLVDGTSTVLTLGEVLDSGKLVRSKQMVTQKKAAPIEGTFEGITMKDIVEMGGYTGGATELILHGLPVTEGADPVVRPLSVATVDNPGAMISLARDGVWNDPETQGAFRFILKDEDPKTTWVRSVNKLEFK